MMPPGEPIVIEIQFVSAVGSITGRLAELKKMKLWPLFGSEYLTHGCDQCFRSERLLK
jgi:hypothetical protein